MIPTAFGEFQHAIDDTHRPLLTAVNLHLCTDALKPSYNCHLLSFFERSSGHPGRGEPLRMLNLNRRIGPGGCVPRIDQHSWQCRCQIAKMIEPGCSLCLNGFFRCENNGRKSLDRIDAIASTSRAPLRQQIDVPKYTAEIVRELAWGLLNSFRAFAASAFMGEIAWMARRTRKSCAQHASDPTMGKALVSGVGRRQRADYRVPQFPILVA